MYFIGLDPARPYFENNILKEHLQHGDANFVDIVHTNKGDFGWKNHVGDADFWPNKGGWAQPTCLAEGQTTGKLYFSNHLIVEHLLYTKAQTG